MSRGPLLFFGIFLTMASSFWGLILAPQLQIGQQAAVALEDVGQFYPALRPGMARQGAEVYRALGCVDCHSQQVRGLGSDLERGWGRRISVAQDYLYDYPALIGQQRLGPDLANIGIRQTNVVWQFMHLYNPKLTVVGSPMPRYPFLFDKEPEDTRFPTPAALPMVLEEDGHAFRLVPKPAARALVAYMLSLQSDTALFEAPLPPPPTNAAPAEAAAGATNAVETVTNAPPTNAVESATNTPAQ